MLVPVARAAYQADSGMPVTADTGLPAITDADVPTKAPGSSSEMQPHPDLGLDLFGTAVCGVFGLNTVSEKPDCFAE